MNSFGLVMDDSIDIGFGVNPFKNLTLFPFVIGYTKQITQSAKSAEHILADRGINQIGQVMNKLNITDIETLFGIFNKALLEVIDEAITFYSKADAIKKLEIIHKDNSIEEINKLMDSLDNSAFNDTIEFKLYQSIILTLRNINKYYNVLLSISKNDESKIDTPEFNQFIEKWVDDLASKEKIIFD